MASTWGNSWATNWGVSWDYFTPVAVVASGRWKEGMEAIHKERHVLKKGYYPPSHNKEVMHAAYVFSKAGGHARAESLSPQRRSSIASAAAKARWK